SSDLSRLLPGRHLPFGLCCGKPGGVSDGPQLPFQHVLGGGNLLHQYRRHPRISRGQLLQNEHPFGVAGPAGRMDPQRCRADRLPGRDARSLPARPDQSPDGAGWMGGGSPPGSGRPQTGEGEGPMRAILWAEVRQVLRRPTMYLLMLLLTVLFAATFGQQVTQDRTVPVFSEEMDQEEVDRMVERLSGYEPASFEAVEADEALRKIDAGEADIALELTEAGYRLLAPHRAMDVSVVEQLVRGVLEQERRLNRAAEELNQPPEKVEKEVAEYLKQPPLMLSVTTFRTEGGFRYDAQAQAVFGMTLFYAIYTITYTVS